MPRKRTLITKGVYRDKFGVAIIISVNGKPREFRKDSDGRRYDSKQSSTWFTSERQRVQAREAQKYERATALLDRFDTDVQRFLNTLSGGHKVNTDGYLKHWVRAFPDRQRNEITELDVQTAFASIERAASTKRHIRRALVNFYETLNGVSGYNPARILTPPPKRQHEARAIPYPAIEKIFAALEPSRARARLKLLAYVGLPQKQIKLLQPADVRLKTREVIAHPRRKGAGAAGRALPLSAMAVEAFKEFVALDAFGTFQNSQLVRTFRLGAKRAGVTLADDAVPYDLRHSFLTEVYRVTGDPYALSEVGMHATLEQGTRYVKGALSARATKAIRAVPRFHATTKGQKPPFHSTSVLRRTANAKGKHRKAQGQKARNSRGKL